MLTWNEQNALAAGWPQDKDQGLTKAGVKAVRRIRDLGMVMDVSHLNDKKFWDVMRACPEARYRVPLKCPILTLCAATPFQTIC
ncbi:MAG: membrane dipeptidase [Enterocloster sp.]